MSRPRDMPAWMRWVERQVAELRKTARSTRQVPVGVMVRWPVAASLPPGWLFADGAQFSAVDYPVLDDLLGVNATPAPNPGTDNTTVWIIRAD